MTRWNENEIDQFLDNALSEFSCEIPRAGLEQRIMATLATPANRNRALWWRLPIAALAVGLMVTALWIWNANNVPSAPPMARISALPPALGQAHSGSGAVAPVHKSKKIREIAASGRAEPKLPTFPSQPDAGQARMLLQFVQVSPREAKEAVDDQNEFRELAARNAEPLLNHPGSTINADDRR